METGNTDRETGNTQTVTGNQQRLTGNHLEYPEIHIRELEIQRGKTENLQTGNQRFTRKVNVIRNISCLVGSRKNNINNWLCVLGIKPRQSNNVYQPCIWTYFMF